MKKKKAKKPNPSKPSYCVIPFPNPLVYVGEDNMYGLILFTELESFQQRVQ